MCMQHHGLAFWGVFWDRARFGRMLVAMSTGDQRSPR